MKKLFKAVRWFLINGLFASGIYFGFFQGVDGAANTITFFTAILFLFSLLAPHQNMVEAMVKNDYQMPVPRILDVLFDVGVIIAFSWSGHFVLATMYSIHIFCMALTYDKFQAEKIKQQIEQQEVSQ